MNFSKLFPLIVLILLGFPTTAQAQKIFATDNGQVPIVVSSPGSLVFIGKDKKPVRANFWKTSNGKNKKNVYLTDMDGNGVIDIVGTGTPIFVLNSQGFPTAYLKKKGCFEVLIADFTGDYKQNIACIKGKTISLYTHDLKLIWSRKTAKRYPSCQAGDVNGDEAADLECKNGKILERFNGKNGKKLRSSTNSKITDPIIAGIEPANPNVLEGKRWFDMDGDYILEESILKKGNSVIVRSHTTNKKLGVIKLKSRPITAMIRDLNGDRKLDIIVVTKNDIVIASPDGKSESFSLNAKKYKSKPIVHLVYLSSTGFINTAEDAKKVIHSSNEKLSKCYSQLIYRNQFAIVEKLFIEVVVDEKGKVMYLTTNKLNSSEEKVRACMQKVLKKLHFPKPVDPFGKLQISVAFELEYRQIK